MIDTNLFTTQITAGLGGKGTLSGQALGGNALFGITQSGNLGFLSALLSSIEAPLSDAQQGANNNSENPNGVKAEKADLALLQLALLGQDPDKSLEERLGELKIEKLANTKENRIAQLTKLIEHLTSGLPEQSVENATIEQLVNRLEKKLEKLEANLEALRTGTFENEGAPFKALIATGLNPAQLTKITARIQEVEEKLGRELTVEDLIAGVGNIIPAPGDDEADFATTDALSLLINQSQKNNEERQLEIEKKLKEGNTVRSEDTPLPFDNIEAIQIAPTSAQQSNVISGTELPLNALTEEIAQRLSNGEYKALFGATKKITASLAKLNLGNAQTAVMNTPALHKVESLLSFNFADALASATSISEALGYDIQTGAPFNTSMQAVTHASNNVVAGQTQAATSLVSATISKAAQNGSTKNITLHLDPPELGRVEVRLEFGEKKTVKANIIVEKPETLLMLQRDSHALERALQNAGLETNSNSLNFQMAEQGFDFNSNREGNAQNGGTGSSGDSSEGEDIEFIETTMTWDVDPETGHVHYNILA